MQPRNANTDSILPRLLIPAFGLALIAGCGGDSGSGNNGGGDGTLYPASYDCSTVAEEPQSLVDADFSGTPRIDRTAEVLTMEATGSFTADGGRYQRALAELNGLRSQYENEVTFVRPCAEPDRIIVNFDSDTYAEVEAGTYSDWDELNTALGEQNSSREFDSQAESVTLELAGRYNIPRLKQEYSAFSGVVSAEGIEPGDGNDVCLAVRDDMHFYIFRTAHSNCDTGCESESFSAFEADSSGNLSRVGLYDGLGDEPDWFTNAEDCRAFLRGQDVTAD